MSLTYLVAFLPQVREKIFIIMQFHTAFKVITASDNVIVKVNFVDMSCDNYLTIFKDFCKLHSDFVCLLRRDVFTDLEGLNEMIEANAIGLVTKYLLRGKEGLVRHLRDAVVTRNICQLFALIKGF